jgi:hypothetical protein
LTGYSKEKNGLNRAIWSTIMDNDNNDGGDDNNGIPNWLIE